MKEHNERAAVAILKELADRFPQFDDEGDEPIDGADLVEVVGDLWPRIKDVLAHAEDT